MAPKHHHPNITKLASNINAIVSSRPESSSRYTNKNPNSSANKIIHSKRGSTGMAVKNSYSIFSTKIMRNSSIGGETTADKLENDAKMRRAAKIGNTLGNENEIVQSNNNINNNNSKDEHNSSSITTGNYSML